MFDDREYLESGAFAREVLELARSQGLVLQEQDDRIVSYPSLMRVLPNDAAVEIDRKRDRRIRPSRVVAALRGTRDRPARFKPEAFIEALGHVYELVRARQKKERGGTVKLIDVYRALTILPGQSAVYSQQEFVRDVYLLDESGVDCTRDGLQMTLPATTSAIVPERVAGTE